MKKKLFGTIAVIAFYNSFFSQEKDTARIEEVVVTGQFNPQSIKKSLFKVEVISNDDIKRMAVNNVTEVLNQTLNILIIPEKKSGDSKANIMGLGADYTKVLVDNIPVIGDAGLGSGLDLTKLSLDNIERIEIVKGSMGVEFGNNAVSGVINIITKKSSQKKWNFRGFVQEETVGKEYDWVDYGKGRHIQSLGISHQISEKWFVDLSLNRNDFQGFWGDLGGKNYFNPEGSDSKRGYEWQPKEQWNPAFLVRFSTPKTQMFYKTDYLSEEVNFYNPITEPRSLGAGERTFIANDANYNTTRMLQHFNIQTEIFRKTKFIGDFSYQKQTRKRQNYIFDIPARETIYTADESIFYNAETFYSRGTFNNFLKTNKANLQIGYEGDYTKGIASQETGIIDGIEKDATKEVLNMSVFASTEINLNSNWFLRPGVRINFSDTFNTKPNFSLVLKNNINEQSEFRAIIGSSNKNPTFEQLFAYRVDANHDIRGNEDLKPENSYSGTLFYSVYSKPNANLKWSFDASTMYLQIHDRIDLVNLGATQYRYINVDTDQSWLNTVSGKISNKNFGFNLGLSYLGKALELDNSQENKYWFSTEINSSFYYNVLKSKTSFALYFKGFGKSRRIIENTSLGITQYDLVDQKAFSLLDASISQKIWKDHFTITIGARNIFDVSEFQNQSVGGAHSGGNAVERLYYGRSYFGRLNFNF